MSVLVGAALEGWRRVRLAVRRPDDEDCWFADYVEALGQTVGVAVDVLDAASCASWRASAERGRRATVVRGPRHRDC
ncbi:MAG: hypothetical protein M3O34_05655 [Chloroflexota bacterium]|nr:hypothetical protein [Chloroflexota bacterium]